MKVTNVYDINDYVSMNDNVASIHGYVVLTDEDGKTLFKKHNMIVEAGREVIKNAVLNCIFNGDSTNFPKFKAIKFGNNNDITRSSDGNLRGDSIITSKNTSTIDGDNTRCIKVTTKISSDTSTVISEAGIFLENDKKEEVMFSRVAFAPLTIRTGTEYTLNYYIYF